MSAYFSGGPNFGLHYLPEMLEGMRAFNASPKQIEKLLVAYPKLKLYIMHGGWPFIEDLKSLLYMHPNVYVDIAVVNWILPEKRSY
ncbi:amidohydrolase family protein [Alteromonas sp. KC14]|uniref:amidohydrolase family protein n=1 Tax=Alteromonas sp. KC14 TaxID=2795689 RepID=UPI00192462A0|nr:amidohydrolase family protein [Alteromonas sp. KC14]